MAQLALYQFCFTGIKNLQKTVFFLLLLCFSTTILFAQNVHLVGGGITIGAGATMNIKGNVITETGSTITNNNSILLTGNFTNNGSSYSGTTGTITFNGAVVQNINGTAASTFTNVAINQTPATSVSMTNSVTLTGLTFTNGKININNNTLTINGAVTNTITQGLIGGANSNLTIGNAAGNLSFDQNSLGVSNSLKTLTLNTNATATIANNLDITSGTTTAPGTLSIASGAILNTNDIVTLKSAATGTSRVAAIPVNGAGIALATINGKVIVERFISARRAWRLLCVPLQNTSASETSIFNAWQEGINNTVDLTAGGTYGVDNKNPNPGFGTHITCDRGIYNSTTDGFDAASLFYASLLSHNGTNWGGRPTNTKSTYVTSQPGWMIFVRGSRAANLSIGTASVADVTVLRTKGLLLTGRQTSTTISNPSGYNLVNNPFASSIDLTQCTLNGTPIANIGYYIWDPYILGTFTTVGGYSYYDPILGFLTPPVSAYANNRIESSTAFFVPSIAGQTLIIPEAAKVANNSLVMRPTGNNTHFKTLKTALFISNGSGVAQADACGIVMDESFSNGFSQTEDRLKMNNFSESIGININSKNVVMNYKKPFTDIDTVYFNMSRLGTKNYELQFEPANLQSTSLSAILIDKYTNAETVISLSQATTYSFAVNNDSLSKVTDRFKLVFKAFNTLPVTFTSIKATKIGNNSLPQQLVEVEWKVQQEQDIAGYVVEKSIDGIHFIETKNIPAKNNGVASQIYNWLDENATIGNNFYRIKSIKNTGEKTYSTIVKINIGKNEPSFSIYPNPISNNTIQIQMNNIVTGKYHINVMNSIGQQIYSTSIFCAGNISNLAVTPPSELSKGIYQVNILNNSGYQQMIKIEVK